MIEQIDNMFRTTDDKLFSTHERALRHEVQLRVQHDLDYTNDYFVVDFHNKILIFIAENPRFVR